MIIDSYGSHHFANHYHLNPFALIPAVSDSLMALNRDDATNGRVLVQFLSSLFANTLICTTSQTYNSIKWWLNVGEG